MLFELFGGRRRPAGSEERRKLYLGLRGIGGITARATFRRAASAATAIAVPSPMAVGFALWASLTVVGRRTFTLRRR